MEEILISVVMSVYNGEANIRETIDSILAQSFKDFEFIIINDASTDSTNQILEEYQQKDSRIVLLKNSQNLGLTKSLNKAISYAQGKYIARIDAGDISLPQRLQKQVDYMKSHPDIGLLGTAARIVSQLSEDDGIETDIIYDANHEEILRLMRRKNPFIHPTVMFKTDLFRSLGGYDESFIVLQDSELWTRMIQKTQVCNLQSVLVIVPMYPSSISIANNNKQLRAAIRLHIKKIKWNICPWYYSVYILKYLLLLIIPNSIRANLRWKLRKDTIVKE